MYYAMCVYIYIYIYIQLGRRHDLAGRRPRRHACRRLPGSGAIYIYIYIYKCVCIYIYIYIYTCIGLGGIACLALLVQHIFSSKVTNRAANSISRTRQGMP